MDRAFRRRAVDFALCDLEGNPTDETITVFTTRADTLFGCSFFVLAPEYAGLEALVAGTEYEKPVMEFAEAARRSLRLSALRAIATSMASSRDVMW